MNYTVVNFGKKIFYNFCLKFWERMELPIQQFRSRLQGCVDPLITVGTARRFPHVYNTYHGQTAAAGQH